MRVGRNNRWIQLLLATFVTAFVIAACSTGSETGRLGRGDESNGVSSEDPGEASPLPTSTTTTTIPPQPPEVRVRASAEAFVGQNVSEAIVVTDPNNDEVVIRLFEDGVPGFDPVTNVRGRIIGFDWEPSTAGEWTVEVTATDSGGLMTSEVVELVSRHVPSADMFLAMGDSIAAGFGRDRSDFLSSDECFRSEADSFNALAFEELIEAGALTSEAELLIVACAGVGVDGLSTVPTVPTNAEGEVIGEALTQLERATLLNPAIVTLTVSAPEVGLIDIETFLEQGGSEGESLVVDTALLEARIAELRLGLENAFDVLMTTTSAHVVLTTAYNPVASNPVGVEGCGGDCMVEASATFVDALNEMFLDVAGAQREGRVSIARLDGPADVFEASNGAGIDALRDGLGPLQGLVDTFTGGSNALCADDGGVEDTLISTLDCAHPNNEGQRAIAVVVIEELLSI